MDNSDIYLKKLITNNYVVLILNSIYDAVYIVNKNKEIVFWNKGAESITGYCNDKVIGRRCSDNILNHIDENGNCLCLTDDCPLITCFKHGKSAIEKIYPLHKDNRRFPILGKASPIKDKDGNIIGAIEIFRDITSEEDFRILQEKFKTLIKKYVSSTTYEEISKQSDSGYIGKNTVKDSTVLFVDVVGFKKFSELNPPEEVIKLLNDIFGICEVITKESYGDIDKFIGDSIMATFIDANDAVNAARSILESLHHFNENREKQGKDPVHLHFGINSGKVIQGEIGTLGRKDLTVVGDIVNTAFGIAKISEPDSINITLSTYSRLKDIKGFSYKGKLPIIGKQESIDIYAYTNV